MSLTEESEARKARLLALRRKKDGVEDTDQPLHLKQRNFDPETRNLKKHGASTQGEDTVEQQVHGLAEKIIADDEERRAQELDLFNIAPKRPNWDLKRELERKVVPLERKTQEAIYALIRRRLGVQEGGGEADLLGVVNAQAAKAAAPDTDDDFDE